MSRIAFISSLADVPWGGSEALWFQTALCLRQHGHEVLANIQGWPQARKPVQETERAGIDRQLQRQGATRPIDFFVFLRQADDWQVV